MKTSSLERLRAGLGALGEVWLGASPAFAADAVTDEFESMSGPGLVRVIDAAARMRRSLDAVLARAADEVAKRSAPELGAEGLAKQHGFASPARLLAAATGGAPAEASRLLAVGKATRSGTSFTGEVVPAKFASVRGALDDGTVSVEAAAAITGMLRRVEVRADPGRLEAYEENLVAFAAGQPLSLVMRAVTSAEARLDEDGVAPADERLFSQRALSFHEDGDGLFHLRGRLDPVTAAPIKAALDALVSDALARRGSGAATLPGAEAAHVAGPVVPDQRSIPQLQADALAELAKHALGCAAAPGTAPQTTVVVRMSLDALREGTGLAEIDGIDRPIAAGTVRKLAADTEVIPIVLGADSAPLDLGRAARLFTKAQRIALMERDGGCASCGANITHADAHHVEWWARDGGRTDLANGVMLCTSCHHRIHDQGWHVRIDGPHVWFIPPPHIDPSQHPRLGGRARFHSTSPPGTPRAA